MEGLARVVSVPSVTDDRDQFMLTTNPREGSPDLQFIDTIDMRTSVPLEYRPARAIVVPDVPGITGLSTKTVKVRYCSSCWANGSNAIASTINKAQRRITALFNNQVCQQQLSTVKAKTHISLTWELKRRFRLPNGP